MDWSATPAGAVTTGLLCSGCGRAFMMASGGHCGCDGLPVCYFCGNEIGCGLSTCKYTPCRAGKICHKGCTGAGPPGPLPPVTYTIWLIKRTSNPIGSWYASLGPTKPGWPHGDPYRKAAPSPAVPAPAPPPLVRRVPAPAAPSPEYDDSSMAILNPEQVEHKRAVLTNRVREALGTAVRLGHDVTTFIVLDVRSQLPLSFHCTKCGFDLIIEQRLHPEGGKEAVRGPASVLDCKPSKK